MGPPRQGLCFCAPWAWGIGEQSMLNVWWLDMMEMLEGAEEGGNGGDGLRFSLLFDPRKPGFDRNLLSFPVSALFSHLLGWSKNSSLRRPQGSMVISEGGGESAAAVAVAAAAAVAIYLAALYASDQQPRRPRRRRLSASALARPNSAAMPRALSAPDDGLRILSSNDESLENIIHGTSIGAGDDEPVLVARVETKPTDMAGANAYGETEHGQSEKEQEEIERLKELWLSLLEREQRLELRLMELDGLREQEATVRELENRVSVAAVEARLLELKVSSLQEENQRLNAQVSELDALIRAKLARAKEKLHALKARVQGEQEEVQREAAALRENVAELQREGEERARALAEEAAALRQANAGLEEENMELALRLQDAEQVASSVNLVLEEDVVEEANYLRKTNERLTRQIEQLHSDHCAHVEELVYLKWVNACLRHELRNHEHHPSSGHQDHDAGGLSATDLSKSMSYRSSEKAKQLMLQYGNLGLDGFDPALFSPLHESLYGDGDGNDYDDEQTRVCKDERERSTGMSATMAAATAPTKRARRSKLKFLKNIKNLLAGSRRGHDHGHGRGDRESKKAPIDEHLEKAMRWLSSHDALDGNNSYESTPLSSCERTPMSSVTTVDSHACAGGLETAEAGASRLEAETARSTSDVGASYGREASRYRTIRPDNPAGAGPDGFHAPEKRELRRHSEELRSPEAVHVRTRDMNAE